jgi:hypothetical protein
VEKLGPGVSAWCGMGRGMEGVARDPSFALRVLGEKTLRVGEGYGVGEGGSRAWARRVSVHDVNRRGESVD